MTPPLRRSVVSSAARPSASRASSVYGGASVGSPITDVLSEQMERQGLIQRGQEKHLQQLNTKVRSLHCRNVPCSVAGLPAPANIEHSLAHASPVKAVTCALRLHMFRGYHPLCLWCQHHHHDGHQLKMMSWWCHDVHRSPGLKGWDCGAELAHICRWMLWRAWWSSSAISSSSGWRRWPSCRYRSGDFTSLLNN